MTDYKAMYYHLSGRMATAIDALKAVTGAINEITEKLEKAQQVTEDMFINAEDDGEDLLDESSK